ncbi:TetR/AcrR family transcriptional regulator, partial [Streptococcus anginosus]|nr:TetR/AcrR family transcriptional regulator [Streptococcus anginosus]
NRLKLELEHYLFPLIREKLLRQKSNLPEPFLKNYVTTTFIETVTWWLGQRNKLDEATITAYYLELMH